MSCLSRHPQFPDERLALCGIRVARVGAHATCLCDRLALVRRRSGPQPPPLFPCPCVQRARWGGGQGVAACGPVVLRDSGEVRAALGERWAARCDKRPKAQSAWSCAQSAWQVEHMARHGAGEPLRAKGPARAARRSMRSPLGQLGQRAPRLTMDPPGQRAAIPGL